MNASPIFQLICTLSVINQVLQALPFREQTKDLLETHADEQPAERRVDILKMACFLSRKKSRRNQANGLNVKVFLKKINGTIKGLALPTTLFSKFQPVTACLYLCWKPSKACMIFDRIFPYLMSLWLYITINRPCLLLTHDLIWSMQAVLNIYRFNIQNAKGFINVVFGGRRVLWGVCLPVCRFGKCTMYQACLCARHTVYCKLLLIFTTFIESYVTERTRNGGEKRIR